MNETMTLRKRRSREEWQHLIVMQAAGDLTQVAHCKANGLSLSSFCYWKRQLEAEQPVPVEPWVDLGTLNRRTGSGWDIELNLGEGICLGLRRC